MDYRDLIVSTVNKIRERKSELERCIIDGHPKDFIEYRAYQGEIKGLQTAIDIYQTILRGELNAT